MYRIAVVDDNQSWCYVLELRLQQEGYAVSSFTNVQDFLREAEQFDLALIDFSIPAPPYQKGMDGPELIRQLRRFRHSPLLVLISSFFTKDVLNDVTSICPEADAILSKQTDTQQLFSQIRQLLARRSPVSSGRLRS
jgi:CheY-like chemotaxis protein